MNTNESSPLRLWWVFLAGLLTLIGGIIALGLTESTWSGLIVLLGIVIFCQAEDSDVRTVNGDCMRSTCLWMAGLDIGFLGVRTLYEALGRRSHL